MKIRLWIGLCCLAIAGSVHTNAKNVLKTAQTAVCKITTYTKDGKARTGYGFFYEKGGKLVSAYDLFKYATRATVTNSKGQEYDVTRIIGASDTYNLVTARTNWEKAPFIEIADSGTVGAILGYGKSKKVKELKIKDKSSLYSYSYYTYDLPNDSVLMNLPVVNTEGQVIAITQANFTKEDLLCGIDARVVEALGIKTISFADKALTDIYIPKALPDNEQEALSYLYLAVRQTQTDSLSVENLISDFLQLYPDYASEALMERANFYASHGNYALVAQDYEAALKAAGKDKKDQVHYAYSKILYTYTHFSLTDATQQAREAYAIKPLPIYLQQLADCYFADKKYQEAAETYKQLCATELASDYSYFQTVRSLMELPTRDTLQLIQLLDSAIAKVPKSRKETSINYYFYRAQLYFGQGEYRKAVFDYNEIEEINPQKLTPFFYQMRAQSELAAHMYQQALDDTDRLIIKNPQKAEYYFLKIEVLLSAGEITQALDVANQCVQKNPENAAAYRILGIVQAQAGKKTEAETSLKKAAELGDRTALELIDTQRK